jgi:hypothetical protein
MFRFGFLLFAVIATEASLSDVFKAECDTKLIDTEELLCAKPVWK